MKKKIIITLIILLIPVAVITILKLLSPEDYSITTEKDNRFDKKVERILVIVEVEKCLILVFAHSLEHSMEAAFQTNSVKAIVNVNPSESDSLMDNNEETRGFQPDAMLRIQINPLYRTRDDGYQAIVGTDFQAKLTDTATAKTVWNATGKVDYIVMFGRHYRASEGIRKEFAWHTTAAIVESFITDINGQEAVPIYTVTEVRQRHGQRVD